MHWSCHLKALTFLFYRLVGRPGKYLYVVGNYRMEEVTIHSSVICEMTENHIAHRRLHIFIFMLLCKGHTSNLGGKGFIVISMKIGTLFQYIVVLWENKMWNAQRPSSDNNHMQHMRTYLISISFPVCLVWCHSVPMPAAWWSCASSSASPCSASSSFRTTCLRSAFRKQFPFLKYVTRDTHKHKWCMHKHMH